MNTGLMRFSDITKVAYYLCILMLCILLIIIGIMPISTPNLLTKGRSLKIDKNCSFLSQVNLSDLQINFDQVLTEKASHIIIGDVKAIESRWNEDETLIYTYITISILDCLKESIENQEITIKKLGGEIGEIGLFVSNVPSLIEGEKVKLFLKRIGENEFTILGKSSLDSEASSGYSYSGIHWHSKDLPVEYYINESGTLDTNNEFIAVQSSFQKWEDDPGSFMDYTYIGTIDREGAVNDDYNVVSWSSIDGPGGAIAICTIWYDTSTKLISEFDLVFDDDEIWSTTGESDKYDVQNIGTHEAGHTLHLNDLYNLQYKEETMYGYTYPGETKKRSLNAGDIAGIRYIYGNIISTYKITTEPEGLEIKVDGEFYTSPNSFNWYRDSVHIIEAPSPQSEGEDIRYVYSSWGDGGAREHSITVGLLNTTIVANFNVQYSVEFNVMTIGPSLTNSTNYVTVSYLTNEESINTEIWDNSPATVWCDANSTANYSNPSSGSSSNHRWYSYNNTSITIGSPAEVNLIYYEQFLNSYIFKDDKDRTIVPKSFRIMGPNEEDLTFYDYSDLWLNFGIWTVEKILWEGVDVKPENNFSLNINSSKVWMINCSVYDFKIIVTDLFGLPISETKISITLPNGTTIMKQSDRDGSVSISQVAKGTYTASITHMGQNTTISGDVAQASLIPSQAKIYFSIPVIITLCVIFTAVIIMFIILRKRKKPLR